MHPILFNLGSFPIGTYGVLLAGGALLALWLMRKLALREGLDPEVMTDLFVASLLAAFVGAKVAMIIGDFRAFAAAPVQFLVSNLRMFGAFYGGFLAAVVAAGWLLHKKKVSFWKAADVAAPALALAQGLGRLGCFFAGCCYGKATDLPWGLSFPAVPICEGGAKIHPWPLYESLVDLSLALGLYLLFPKRKFTGQLFLIYVLVYASARFGLEYLRGDDVRGLYFGGALSLSQIVALAALLGAVAAWTWKARLARERAVAGK